MKPKKHDMKLQYPRLDLSKEFMIEVQFQLLVLTLKTRKKLQGFAWLNSNNHQNNMVYTSTEWPIPKSDAIFFWNEFP